MVTLHTRDSGYPRVPHHGTHMVQDSLGKHAPLMSATMAPMSSLFHPSSCETHTAVPLIMSPNFQRFVPKLYALCGVRSIFDSCPTMFSLLLLHEKEIYLLEQLLLGLWLCVSQCCSQDMRGRSITRVYTHHTWQHGSLT